MAADVQLNQDVLQLTGDAIRGAVSNNGANTFDLDVKNGKLAIGGKGTDGDVILINKEDKKRVHIAGGDGPEDPDVRILMNGFRAKVKLGGKGAGGELIFRDNSDEAALQLVCNKDAERLKKARILLDGESGTAKFNDVLLGTIGSLTTKLQSLETRLAKLESVK